MRIESFKELTVYTKGCELAMAIYQATQSFPKEERYAITSQIRRSSRSVCACLAEAWAKRRYEAHFISKLTDADAENKKGANPSSRLFPPPARRPVDRVIGWSVGRLIGTQSYRFTAPPAHRLIILDDRRSMFAHDSDADADADADFHLV